MSLDTNLSSTKTIQNASSTSPGPSDPELALVILLSIVSVVTVIGNTLVILAVLTTRRLRTITNCFVVSLAMADWLVGILVLPPAIAYNLMGKN